MARDSLAVISRYYACHVIAEDYSYKSEAYYTILARAWPVTISARPAVPCSMHSWYLSASSVRKTRVSRSLGVGISLRSSSPLPVILYGLNYFAHRV